MTFYLDLDRIGQQFLFLRGGGQAGGCRIKMAILTKKHKGPGKIIGVIF